jgi:thiol-disulfide isomerase/thioredoxin
MKALILICILVVSAAAQQSDPLPEFSLRTLKGQTVTSLELKDSIVILDFWATWCEGCITEIPAFNRLEQKYGPRGVKVIGLAVLYPSTASVLNRTFRSATEPGRMQIDGG